MRNFYLYKDNREKVIQVQLGKVEDQLEKQILTPAKLLINSNMASQLNTLVQKSKMPARPSEAPKRIDRTSANAMSMLVLLRTLCQCST